MNRTFAEFNGISAPNDPQRTDFNSTMIRFKQTPGTRLLNNDDLVGKMQGEAWGNVSNF